MNASFFLNIPWKFCVNLNIFHIDIKENESMFFSEHSVLITTTTNYYCCPTFGHVGG